MMSIRTRFAIISVLSVTVALLFASWFLVALFTDNFSRRIDTELSGHLNRLAGSLEFNSDSSLKMPGSPADNRFLEAYGGLYWQIDDDSRNSELRSPSLFDYALPLPQDGHPLGAIHRYRLKGPEGTDVMVQERALLVSAPGGARKIRIAVAMDAAVIDEARSSFAWSILPYVAGLAVFLIAMSTLQLTIGLKPLDTVARDLDAIRNRRLDRLPGPYPRELAGLVGQLNHLLESQAASIDKARRRASDLAHGLKTPLTAISNNAFTLRENGETAVADELDQLADTMLAHVDHELARARIVPSPEQRKSDASPAKIAADVVRTLRQTSQGRALDWQVDIPEPLTLPIDPYDLRELLGNLLENAGKWAKSRVTCSTVSEAGSTLLVIEDDGPGIAEDQRAEVLKRGIRLDHQKPGSGLGLAIVKEIVDVYGARLSMTDRAPRGLKVSITFAS